MADFQDKLQLTNSGMARDSNENDSVIRKDILISLNDIIVFLLKDTI